MTEYDSPWEEALCLFFEWFLAMLYPAAHAEIDWSRCYESLEQELRQTVHKAELGQRRVDHLAKVWLADGQERWLTTGNISLIVHRRPEPAGRSFPLTADRHAAWNSPHQ